MKQSAFEILKSVGAILADDHFVLTSGQHTDSYVNKDGLYPHVKQTSQVCRMMAEKCQQLAVETVAAPAKGGIILSQWVAYYLSELKGQPVYGVYAEKDGQGGFGFARGYDQYVRGKNVLVLEDLTTTGASVKKVVELVRQTGGKVVGVCVMLNRNPDLVNQKMFGAPFFALEQRKIDSWSEDKMPEWLSKRPINVKVGHGREYLRNKADKIE
ncbi:MAG: phosphoribosyltransferase [Candidatus Pacebacteria bacterium]|nr:phosphoribosyltransferase [Candidatus Paceibacterota bacterium]